MPKKTTPKPELAELKTFPARLTYARTRGKLTKSALAEKASLGIAQITRFEQGERVEGIEAATIIRLAKALKVPVGWLAADEGEAGPIPVFREAGDRRSRSKPDGE